MNPVPSWLSNIINLLAPVGLIIAMLFAGVEPEQTGETVGLLDAFLNNLWAVGVMIVQGVKGIVDSVKRWGQDNPEGFVAKTFNIEKP